MTSTSLQLTASTVTSNFRQRAAAITALVMAQGLVNAARASADSLLAAADQDPTALPAIEVGAGRIKQVSSPKYTQPLRDTPQTIVVIPNAIYAEQGAATLSDVLRNTPGITFAAGEGGNANATAGDSFYMRGYDATNNIFVDGVRDVGAYSRDVFNIDSVEVAKGPSGADIGRGGASGYVNLVTKQPRLENFVRGTLSFGVDEISSGTRRRASIDINESLPESSIRGAAVRLNAVIQDSDGIGRDFAKTQVSGIAPSLALGLGTPTRAFVSYQHTVTESIPDYGLPSPAFPGFVSTPPPPKIDPTTFYGFTSDFDRATNNALLGRVERDLGANVTLSNQTRYSTVSRDAVVTGPGTSPTSYIPATQLLTRSRQANRRDTDILSNLTSVIAHFSTGAIDHDLTAGLELDTEHAYQPAFVSATLDPILVTKPDANAQPSGAPTRSGATTDATVDTVALYAFDTIKFNPQWQLNGGLRADHYKIDYLSIAATTFAPTKISGRDTLVSWKSGLVFKPVPAGSIYLSYGLAYRPPGTDFALSSAVNNQNNPDTKPQKTTNLELGAKWDFLSGRLQANASIFETKNSNTVFTDAVLGAIPAGKQTVRGIELGLTGRMTNAWLVFAGVSYLDAAYDVGTAAQNGASLPLTPDYSGNFWTTYRFTQGFTVGGGAQYMGEASRLDTSTTVPRTMPSYWLFNVVAAYDLSPRATLRLNVSNVFDATYVRSFNNNGGRFSPGSPRSYLLSADIKF